MYNKNKIRSDTEWVINAIMFILLNGIVKTIVFIHSLAVSNKDNMIEIQIAKDDIAEGLVFGKKLLIVQ